MVGHVVRATLRTDLLLIFARNIIRGFYLNEVRSLSPVF